MKILHTADMHIKLRSDDRYKSDLIAFMQFFIQTAREQKPSHVLLAGDLFDKKEPTPTEYSLFFIFVKQLLDLGIHVVLNQGNHDEPDNTELDHTIKPLRAWNFPNLHVLDEVGMYDVEGITVLSLPYIYRNRDIALQTIKKLHDGYTQDNPLILLGHCWVEGYMDVMPPASEFVVLKDYLNALHKVQYGALGHIHCAGMPVPKYYYPGSPYRTTWGETEPEKVINLVTEDSVQHITTPAMPIKVIDIHAYTEEDLNVQNHMVLIRAKNIDVSLIATIENIREQLQTKGNIVQVNKKMSDVQYGSAETAVRKVTPEQYINDYVKSNNCTELETSLNTIITDIVTGKITKDTAPHTIKELDLHETT